MIQTLSELATLQNVGGTALLLGVLATLVQISPIKINPWSWVAKRIGRAINGEVLEKVEQLETRVNNLKDTVEERAAKDARTRILRFGDECLHGDRHSKEHFDEILRDITDYETYCDEHRNFKNNMAVLTIASIKSNYQERLRQHDFL